MKYSIAKSRFKELLFIRHSEKQKENKFLFTRNYLRRKVLNCLLYLFKMMVNIRSATVFADPSLENTGTTATVCLLRNGNELVTANVGDSRAMVCRKGKAMRLMRDHEPEYNAQEKARIKRCGGFIR